MKVEIDDIGACYKSLKVEIPSDKIKEEYEKACETLVKQAKVKGFRKGKVPRRIVEALYRDLLKQQIVNSLVPEYYEKVFKNNNLVPISDPQVELGEMEIGKPFIFTVSVEVKPQFNLKGYKGIKVSRKQIKVTQEEIEAYLKHMQQEYAELKPKDGKVEKGDYVYVDFDVTVEGKPFTGSKGENVLVKIGEEEPLPDFEVQLLGAEKGERRTVRAKLPGDFEEKELRGKEAEFHVVIKEIKEKVLYDLDDTFASEIVGDFSSFEELYEDVKKRLEKAKLELSERDLKRQIVKKLVEENPFPVPQSFIKRQFEYLRQRKMRKNAQSSPEENEVLSDSELLKEAEDNIREVLILDKIAELEGIDATEEEIKNRVEALSKATRVTSTEVRSHLEKKGTIETIKSMIREDKVLKFLLKNAEIKIIDDEESEEKIFQGGRIIT